jgi:hypothetical protein
VRLPFLVANGLCRTAAPRRGFLQGLVPWVAIALVAHQPALLAKALAAADATPATTSDLGAIATRWLQSHGALGSFLVVVLGFLLFVLYNNKKLHAIKGGLRPKSKVSSESLPAYGALIDKLLYCPSGEENIILKGHRELLDLGLVFQMLDYCMVFKWQGNADAAEFLGHLHDEIAALILQSNSTLYQLDLTKAKVVGMLQTCSEERQMAYVALLQQLLTCQGEEQKRIMNARRDLLDIDFMRQCYHIYQRLVEQNQQEAAAVLRSFVAELANVIPTPKPKPAVDLDLTLSI